MSIYRPIYTSHRFIYTLIGRSKSNPVGFWASSQMVVRRLGWFRRWKEDFDGHLQRSYRRRRELCEHRRLFGQILASRSASKSRPECGRDIEHLTRCTCATTCFPNQSNVYRLRCLAILSRPEGRATHIAVIRRPYNASPAIHLTDYLPHSTAEQPL